ncbi:M48 family metallopeptidase [Dehalobacter sp. DCM]|uniref:M48 family metallopeptidase n=1 Tax=Dehalobacter sp. DCM TaxID=2907827 RepID=UPI0030812DC9|nr:M48 family metallopeptidase [Dehalobacter sp. DCM]
MDYLRIGNRVIEYELRKSKKAQRLVMTIKGSKMIVSVPGFVTFAYARNYLESHKHQILKKLEKIQAKATNNNFTKNYISGEKHLYRGRYYPLHIEEMKGSTKGSGTFAEFVGSRIHITITPGLTEQEKSNEAKRLLEQWYISQAKKLLPEQVDYYAKQLNLSYSVLRIKDQKTKWGSCSSKKAINLNWRIIMAPNQVIAYVILHELVHLKHMNHSRDFWVTLESYFPDYKKWRKWLKDNGNELMA